MFVLLSVLFASVGAYAQVVEPAVPPGKITDHENTERYISSSSITREVNSPNLSASAPDGTIISKVPDLAPRIDGLVSNGEWSDAVPYSIPQGTLYVLNDLTALYLLVDLASETDQNSPGSLTLTFDINNNATKDNGIDVKLGYAIGDDEACLKKYASPNIWMSCQPTGSIFRSGWGSTATSAVPHRFYEAAVSLAEISPSTALSPIPDLPDIPPAVHMGIQIDSSLSASPSLLPPNHQTDFSQLLKVALDQTEIKLLILGHTDDISALQTLEVHKDLTGMPSYLLDWVVVAQFNQSIGYDDPERIKKAIATYEKDWNIEYALLVGDANRFPIRYTITDREEENQRAYYAYYSADLYYADLYESDLSTFEDWDANDDHYYGEIHGNKLAGVVNYDDVDLVPDIAVGRVPASDTTEVSTYVNKVINYEFYAYESEWHKKALMVATTDWWGESIACTAKEDIRKNILIPERYTVGELYQDGNPCLETNLPTPANINHYLNQGFGFVNYMGHGDPTGWAIPGGWYTDNDLALLTNQNKLTIAFAAACDTARYTTEPPYDAYTDVWGVEHIGTDAGEIFLTKPIQPSPIQANHNLDAFVEEMLVNRSTGAVGYIGSVTGAQDARDLDKFFFAALNFNQDTLGAMWQYMVIFYYITHPDPGSIDPPDWEIKAEFHQPWKFHLFGDPSLRIDGVPPRVFPPLYQLLYLPLVRR
jgi:hypothetical protein